MSLKAALKRHLQSTGWYVRKTAGLQSGIDLFNDLRKLGISPKCILDIGAHHGQTAAAYSGAFPSARVFAFEPVSANFRRLAETASKNPKIRPVHAAVGDQPGKASIRLCPDNSQAHSFIWAPGDQTECVELITIDNFCLAQKQHPNFMKIDVEGFELKVLAGAKRTLADESLAAVVVEATLDPDNRSHTQLPDLDAALKPHGFRLVAIYDQCLWQETATLAFFNVLFLRQRTTAT